MIVLFESVTTESALQAIEKDASLYDGMYTDMKIDKERKFVKDKASVILSLLKKLDRTRIDKTAEFKKEVELEAAEIKSRLEDANKPFTELMDKYKEVRKVELEQQKQLKAAKDLAFQMPFDHEEALSMDELFDFKAAKIIKEQKERDDKIASEAAEQAKQIEIKKQEDERKLEEDKIKKLKANKKYVGKIRGEIKQHLMSFCGIDEKTAKSVVLALLKTNRVTINYE